VDFIDDQHALAQAKATYEGMLDRQRREQHLIHRADANLT
jgi:hypothetical protein